MTDTRATIGPEGLATTIASMAAQLSAVEKSQDLKTEALRREIILESARLEGTIASEAKRLCAMMTAESRRIMDIIEAVRKEAGVANENISAQIDVVKELTSQVSQTNWAAHSALHHQEQEAVSIATLALDKRLDGMNEFRAQITDMTKEFATKESTVKDIGNIESRLFRLEEDTRRRFEQGETKQRDRFDQTQDTTRTAIRPLEDVNTGRMAIFAAVIFAITVISFIVVLLNVMTGP